MYGLVSSNLKSFTIEQYYEVHFRAMPPLDESLKFLSFMFVVCALAGFLFGLIMKYFMLKKKSANQ